MTPIPLTIVTLDDIDQTKMFVCEDPQSVVDRVREHIENPLIGLTRWEAGATETVWVRPGDVRKVEVNR